MYSEQIKYLQYRVEALEEELNKKNAKIEMYEVIVPSKTDNQLIAEFMGWYLKNFTTIPTQLHLSNLELDNGEIFEFKFNTSWDWLVCVVQRIEQDCEGVPQEMLNISLYSDINEVYNAVLEYIKNLKTI